MSLHYSNDNFMLVYRMLIKKKAFQKIDTGRLSYYFLFSTGVGYGIGFPVTVAIDLL